MGGESGENREGGWGDGGRRRRGCVVCSITKRVLRENGMRGDEDVS